jgi:hypothetical protein
MPIDIMQNTKLNIYTASLMVCAGVTMIAGAAEATDLSDSQERPPYQPWTVGAEAGTTGLGGFGSWRFFYFDHAHHWALAGELGVAYTGDSRVSLTRSGGINSAIIDAAMHYEQQKAQDWANQFRWLPVVKLMVTYSF